jgi:hypothetical protein
MNKTRTAVSPHPFTGDLRSTIPAKEAALADMMKEALKSTLKPSFLSAGGLIRAQASISGEISFSECAFYDSEAIHA